MIRNSTSVICVENSGILRSLFILISFFVFTESSQAYKNSDTLYTMYRYPIAAGGVCMPEPDGSAASVLRRNGISYQGRPSSGELEALAKGIGQIENLLGKPLPAGWRTTYNYINASGKWNQGASAINVRRSPGSCKGENVGRLMHELGHKVGNSGVYSQYRSYVGSSCGITGYARTKSNEQFAEVFSAYVTYPDLLKKKCPQAYSFFATKLFPNSQSDVATCSNSDRLMAQKSLKRDLASSASFTKSGKSKSTKKSSYYDSRGDNRNTVYNGTRLFGGSK